jgi:hypothetical protein
MVLSELSFHDLQRLRRVVRRLHMQYYPAEFCTDRECDRLIETFVPMTVERLLKKLVDGKVADSNLIK